MNILERRFFLLSGFSLLLSSQVLADHKGLKGTGSRLSSEEVDTLLRLHNEARAEVGVKALTWSNKLARVAQKWAEHLAARGTFEHSGSKYGENLAGSRSVEGAVGLWADEKALFKKGVGYRPETGHYTQMVWNKTKSVGCGKADGPRFTIWVCNYDPPGNFNNKDPY